MATKKDNIVTFYGAGYGQVQLVKRSLARRFYSGLFYDPLLREHYMRKFWYWRGQLVHPWEGTGPRPGEEWGVFDKGQVVWLDAEIFYKVEAEDIKKPG
jgi:hypothetical protein